MDKQDFGIVPDMEEVVADVVSDLPALVPFKDAARRLGVSEATLRRWVAKGRLKALKTAQGACGRVLVPRAEIARLVRLLAS